MRTLRLAVYFFVGISAIGVEEIWANNGQEGTFEYAIDAPWRVEPLVQTDGKLRYGAIPIVISITDENNINYDASPERQIGNYCRLEVTEGRDDTIRKNIGFADLLEVEMTGTNSTNADTGSWLKTGTPPPHGICAPHSAECAPYRSPHGSSEWYATAWYRPDGGLAPGEDMHLRLTAVFTRNPTISCSSTDQSKFLRFKNSVSIHAGEAPLPRFKDARWAYGDLHYHSQGTDNEGESGYGYRPTLHAMGAMGLDFALASEHASDSEQFLDADLNNNLEIFTGDLTSGHGRALRDMSADRFRFLHDELWRAGGANLNSALFEGQYRAQSVLSRGIAPQIFLGGEVDAIPELGPIGSIVPNFANNGSFPFGNHAVYSLKNLCGGWKISSCPQSDAIKEFHGAAILQDAQGFNEMHPARVHMVYIPSDERRTDVFVSSRTGVTGGGGRQLYWNDGVISEMASVVGASPKGYTFLAHPIPMGACDGKMDDLSGGPGPDIVPYTPVMLDQVFRSSAVLGLEFWNEDIRMKNAASRPDHAGDGGTREQGFHTADDSGAYATGNSIPVVGGHFYVGLRNSEPVGFKRGVFDMWPWSSKAWTSDPQYAHTCSGVEWMLHHGQKLWDDMLIRGLFPHETSSIGWLTAGEPRRLFIAGGSDAHGDLNYNRAGYYLGLNKIDDMAIGKPRNLVMAGSPERVLHAGPAPSVVGVGTTRAFSQSQVLRALREGAFSVTDGPALRIAIDKNNNGKIDDGDAPMGSVVEMYGDKVIPLLVEWDSTDEWGPITQIELVVGAVNSTEPYNGGVPGYAARFAAVANGPRSIGTPPSLPGPIRGAGNGKKITYLTDGYAQDPTPNNLLRISPPQSFSGTRKVNIPIEALSVGEGAGLRPLLPDRLYVRAFARSRPVIGTTAQCRPDSIGGKCITRYAYTNPIWFISPRNNGTCPANRTRAIDSDGDGIPDGCDPCPHAHGNSCTVASPPSNNTPLSPH